jgi:hypothetical protein
VNVSLIKQQKSNKPKIYNFPSSSDFNVDNYNGVNVLKNEFEHIIKDKNIFYC